MCMIKYIRYTYLYYDVANNRIGYKTAVYIRLPGLYLEVERNFVIGKRI